MTKLKTIDIKGKAYVTVNERIKVFRQEHPSYAIITSMKHFSDGECIFRAEVYDDKERCIAVGHAHEKESSSYINKTSYIENCETSAIGRALGCMGIGVDDSYASADEVINATSNQGKKDASVAPQSVIESVSLALEGVGTISALMSAYKQHESEIEQYPSIKAMFTQRKQLIKKAQDVAQ